MTGLHPRGDQLEHTGVYTCADGKAESVYLAAGCPWVPRRSGLYIELSARATMAVSAIFWTINGVHPLGWTDGEGENRLTEPGFRGESPWPSTARIRSSSSARSSKNFWVGSHCTPSPGATGSAAI